MKISNSVLATFPPIGKFAPSGGKQIGDKAEGGLLAGLQAVKDIAAQLTSDEAISETLEIVEMDMQAVGGNIILGGLWLKLGLGKNAGKESVDLETFVAVASKMAEARKVELPEVQKYTSRQVIANVV